jgi:hypothetical protein
MIGDWKCPKCKVMIFSSKNKCTKCNSRKGDWECPKCNGIIFASKKKCLKCDVENPEIKIEEEKARRNQEIQILKMKEAEESWKRHLERYENDPEYKKRYDYLQESCPNHKGSSRRNCWKCDW